MLGIGIDVSLVLSLPRRIGSLFGLLTRPSPPAPLDEELLSLDLEENDFLYRIRRNKRVVYVSVLDGDIVPEDWRTDGYRVLSSLRKVPRWTEEWQTITIRKTPSGIESTLDEFLPHGLDLGRLDVSSVPFYNLFDLTKIGRIGERLYRVRYDGKPFILKVAAFKHELRYLQKEVATYLTPVASGFPMAPRFIGLVYEETKTRTNGILIEKILGTVPDIRNLEDCKQTVRLLHTHGIIHGDLNRYNFLITEQGAKIFDFESAVHVADAALTAAEDEIESLEAKLKDESDVGQHWRVPYVNSQNGIP